MLHHLQVLCGSVDMLALVMCFAGSKMYNSAATKVHKLGYLGSEGMALQQVGKYAATTFTGGIVKIVDLCGFGSPYILDYTSKCFKCAVLWRCSPSPPAERPDSLTW